MLEEIIERDEALTEEDFYDGLLFLLGDIFPNLSEEELEDMLDEILDRMPDHYAESVLSAVGSIGKKFGAGALKFASQNPGLVKGVLTAAGTVVGGPLGAKLGGSLGNLLTGGAQKGFSPQSGKMLAMMQDPQAQAAMTRATLGFGNGTAPFSRNGTTVQIPIAIYLRAVIATAQGALKELDAQGTIPPASLSESLPFSEDVDRQGEWLAEQLLEVLSEVNTALEFMHDLAQTPIKYQQEHTSGTRTGLDKDGMLRMDCSEFVCRYLHQLDILARADPENSRVPWINTAGMVDETSFNKLLEKNKNVVRVRLEPDSLEETFIPQKGDIFVWRRDDGNGHTGIVYDYKDGLDLVLILESIGSVGSADEATHRKYRGKPAGFTRLSYYKRNGGALRKHAGFKGYYRPVLPEKSQDYFIVPPSAIAEPDATRVHMNIPAFPIIPKK